MQPKVFEKLFQKSQYEGKLRTLLIEQKLVFLQDFR